MDKKEILMIVFIGVLLITTAIQTVQLVSLGSAKVVTTGAATVPATGGASQGSGGGGVPTNLQNLPSMVGGC